MTSPAKRCIYCGADAQTRDHVPPKSFFPEPRPSDLITVPCCLTCNRGFQRYDDYAQTVLALREDVGDHRAIQSLLPKWLRRWERPESGGLRHRIVATSRSAPVHTPGGILLGHVPAYGISVARMHRFIERLIRGLFFFERGYTLQAEYVIRVLPFMEQAEDTLANIQAFLLTRPVRTLGDGVFSYCWRSASRDTDATAWLLTFYNRIIFSALTASGSRQSSLPSNERCN